MGSAAAYQLARRGQRVLGLDAFAAGSYARLVARRDAHHPHGLLRAPDYVPLLRRAYELWEQTQTAANTRLLHLTGGLFIGHPTGDLVAGSAAQRADARSAARAPRRGRDPPSLSRVLRRGTTRLASVRGAAPASCCPNACIDAHLDLGLAGGAELRHAEPVTALVERRADGVEVDTDQRRLPARRLILTAGAWAGKLLSDLGLPLRPERIPLFWFEPARNAAPIRPRRTCRSGSGRSPTSGDFFGTPHVAWPGVKIGKHHSRQYVDPDTVDRVRCRPPTSRRCAVFWNAVCPTSPAAVA